MPRILIAWELGSNFGHAGEIAAVARHLTDQAEVVVAAQNVLTIRQIAPDLPIKVMAAPFAPPRRANKDDENAGSYPDALRYCGWDDPVTLTTLIEAWRALFDLVQPDVLATQTAPTALLAARGLDLKVANFGSGYNCPPRAQPMPQHIHWEPRTDVDLSEREAQVLAAANTALRAHNAPEMEQFCDLLRMDAYLLTTVPALDHYAPRDAFEDGDKEYVGPLFVADSGAEIEWRAGKQHRVFAYLRPNTPSFEAGVRALARLDPQSCHVILSAPGITDALVERLAPTAVQAINGPVRLQSLLQECHLVVNHSSHGMMAAALRSGVPQIGLPNHPEQIMVSYALGQAGIGLGLVGKYGPDEVLDAIQKVFQSDKIKETVKRIAAQSYEDHGDDPSATVAKRIMNLI